MEEYLRQSHKYLYSSEEEVKIVQAKNKAKDFLKEYIKENGEVDENGNIIIYFEEPLHLSTSYNGLMLQRRVSEYTDDEKLMNLLEDTGLSTRCVKYVTVPEIDLDEVYACNQEGLLTDEEVDSFIEVSETWALVKVK